MKNIFLILIFASVLAAQPQEYSSTPLNKKIDVHEPPPSDLPLTQPPTYAEQPLPEEVLVVYRNQDAVSVAVKNYYCNHRNIPGNNQVGLNLPAVREYGDGIAELIDNNEIIRSYSDTLAFVYYKEFISDVLEEYLSTHYANDGRALKEVVRYIVLCKGIPLKIQTRDRFTNEFIRYNVAVDGLLTALYSDPLNLYATNVLQPTMNPYRNSDPGLTMDYRFMPFHFNGTNGWQLSYLVCRIDGNSLTDVTALIDRLGDPDRSGESYWVLDADTCHNRVITDVVHRYGLLRKGQNKLLELGMKTQPPQYDPACDWILSVSDLDPNGKVIAYSSCGRHSWIQCGESIDYVLDCLNFNYANGAVFNTFESYNGNSMNINNKYYEFALISEFVKMGGSGGIAYPWEPTFFGMSENEIFLPAYAVGYNMVDAAYMSIPYFAWNYTVVGDPFCTIAYGGITAQEDLTINTPSLFTGPVIIPEGVTLTVTENGAVNLRHRGKLEVKGNLVVEPGARFTFANYAEFIIDDSATVSGILDSIFFIGEGNLFFEQPLQFENCEFGGVKITVDHNAGTALSFSHSRFYNRDTVLVITGGADVQAEDNWWGHMTGPHHLTLNPGGMGGSIIGDAVFNPFITHLGSLPIDFTLVDTSGNRAIVTAGLDKDANFNIDTQLGEYALPDSIPPDRLFAGFRVSYPQVYSYVDYRRGSSQSHIYKTYKLLIKRALPNSSVTISWNLPDSISLVLSDDVDGFYFSQVYGSGPNSYTINSGMVDKVQIQIFYNIPPSDLNGEGTQPAEYRLFQNYPNPFNPSTTITYSLPRTSPVSLRIYNAAGQLIRVLERGTKEAGVYQVTFDADGLSSGVYFYRLIANEFTDTKKFLILK